ncbi:MAG: hypothetical protein Q9195_002112 [Heterodermia aff. obscurata]
MRDNRRADDYHRDEAHHKERGRRDRQERSPLASQRREETDAGLRIRGTAKVDIVGRSARESEYRREAPARLAASRKQSRSPRRPSRGEDFARLEESVSPHRRRRQDWREYRGEAEFSSKPRRSHSRTAIREPYRKEKRRRSRSPVFSARIDRGVASRQLDRAFSPPPVSPRIDHYSSTQDNPATRPLDSYAPGGRHRSRSPVARDEYRPRPPRRRSLTPDRRPVPRERAPLRLRDLSPPSKRERSRDSYVPRKERDRGVETQKPILRSRDASRDRHITARLPRKRSPLPTQEEAKAEYNKRRRSRSPQRRVRPKEKKDMYPSGHPMQNPQLHNSAPMQQPYPIHDASRRPPPVDTRHPYSASPQWTPVSSQQGSPHSASPYSQGHPGWGGQQQQYQGQPAYVFYISPVGRCANMADSATRLPIGKTVTPRSTALKANITLINSKARIVDLRSRHQQATIINLIAEVIVIIGVVISLSKIVDSQVLELPTMEDTLLEAEVPFKISNGLLLQVPEEDAKLSGAPPDEDDNPFRPSKDLQVEDQSKQEARMPPPKSGVKESKFSFAFKAKAPPPVAAKSVPDLSLKMKEPPKKENLLDGSKTKAPRSLDPLASRSKSDHRSERSERDFSGDQRYKDDRNEDREYHDPRHRAEKRSDRESRRERERERSPERRIEKVMRKRMKPRPTLAPEFAESKSVYYRKPGNESVVGSGTYGKVFKAIHVYTKDLVALKKIRMEGEKDGFPVTAVREIKLLQSLKHDNVVCLQEVMVEHNDCFMVFEYLSHDLTGLLNHPTFKLEHSHKKHLGKQLFEGLNYLHRRGVLHRDIKAANILVSNHGQLKLADFGLARFFSKRGTPDYTNRVITIWYRSPELLLGETQYGPAVDIWSAACVMIEIFTRHAIFPGDGGEINQLDKIYNVLGTPTRSEWPQLVDMAWFELLRPAERKANTFAEKYQERLTPAAFELLQSMFLYDPANRPTAGDVLEHPYFTTEEPAPKQAIELKDLHGDWHEFESKALRKENERKAQDARRAVRMEEHQKEKEKRRASGPGTAERDSKRPRPGSSSGTAEVK